MLQSTFQNYKLIFWIVTTVFVLFAILKYRKNYSESFNSLTLFIVIFLYTLYWIPIGFDITDEGFTLSKSWFMLHGLWKENIDLTWGSSLIYGIWLSIIGSPSVFWARIAYVLLISFIATYSFKILKLYFSKKEAFLSTIILTIIITFGYPQTANYQNIPTIFMLLSIYYFIKSIKTHNVYFSIYSGIFIGIGIFTRFPVILFIIYPIIYFFIDYLYYKSSKKTILELSFYFYIGLLLSFIAASILLLSTNSFSEYYNVIFHGANNINNETSHSLDVLIDNYLNDIWLILSKSFFIIISTLIILLVTRNDRKVFFKLIISLVFSYFAFYYATNFGNSQNWMYTLFAFGFSALILFILINKEISKKQYTIIYFSIFLFLLSFFGSNNSFRLLIWSGALILPLSVFLLLLSNTQLAINKKIIDFKLYQYIFIIFIIFIFTDRYKYSYRDLKKDNLTYSFNSKPLKGIKSNKKRVEVIDSLYNFLTPRIKSDDQLFVVGTLPMLYFIFNKHYQTKNLWRQPEKEFNSIGKLPDYFIFPLKNPRNFWWPNRNSTKIPLRDSLNYIFYKKLVSESFYKIIYKNKMFTVFKKPDTNFINIILNKGLVAYYPFNGDAKDKSRNNNDGVIFGAKLTNDKRNKKNNAFYFDGKSYIKIKNDSILNPEKQITICAWYKPEKYKGSGSDPILTKGFTKHSPPYYQYHLSVTGILYNKKNGGKINFAVSQQNKLITLSSPPNYLKEDKWYFIVGTYNNGTISLYINSKLVSSKTVKNTGKIKDYKQNLLIGKGNNYNGYIKGTIDEIRIYNRELKSFEIYQLYKR